MKTDRSGVTFVYGIEENELPCSKNFFKNMKQVNGRKKVLPAILEKTYKYV